MFLFIYRREGSVSIALALVTGVFEVFHKRQTQGVNKAAQAGHGNVQRMTEDQYQPARQPADERACRIVGHERQLVEHAAQHTTRQAQGVETDVGKRIARQARGHVIRVPQACADVGEDVAVQVVQ